MMAHDSTPPRPEFDADTVASLHQALTTYINEPENTGSLKPALERIAAEARRKRVHAEQLLVLLKDVWYTLPQPKRNDVESQNRLLQRVVTLCIREYYSS
jgi:hypothetical protein